jgi:hypothetical protein
MKGLNNIPVRFFIYSEEAQNIDGEPGDLIEVDESDFMACTYPISYERNTMFLNGVNQIVLTKMPRG